MCDALLSVVCVVRLDNEHMTHTHPAATHPYKPHQCLQQNKACSHSALVTLFITLSNAEENQRGVWNMRHHRYVRRLRIKITHHYTRLQILIQ